MCQVIKVIRSIDNAKNHVTVKDLPCCKDNGKNQALGVSQLSQPEKSNLSNLRVLSQFYKLQGSDKSNERMNRSKM